MKSYRIKNIRSIVDSGDIEIKPINIFVGTNSSGKSTALRVFPLLKQSSERELSGPLLLNGPIVDYGDIDEVFTRKDLKSKNVFRLAFEFSERMINDKELKIFTEMFIKSIKGASFLSRCIIKCKKLNYVYNFTEDGNCSITLNGKKIVTHITGKTYQASFLPDFKKKDRNEPHIFRMIYNLVTDFSKSILGDSGDSLLNYIFYDDNAEQIITEKGVIKAITESNKQLSVEQLKQIRDFVLEKNAFELYVMVDSYLNRYATRIQYFDPLRARSQRYYRKEELSFNSIDSRGENVYIIIKNMIKNGSIQKFNNWTREKFGFALDIDEIKGHTSITINDSDAGPVNIIDCGFGYSQILPIIVLLWERIVSENDNEWRNIPSIIAIEQPELHLHPSMQGKISEVLINCSSLASEIGLSIPFIIETHSTVVINKIGSMISNGQYKKEDIAIYLFSRDQKGLTKIKKTQFNECGDIEEWPYGFMSAEF